MSSHMATNTRKVTESKPLNRSFYAAKASKEDEFYTQLSDIEKELKHYGPHFKGKKVRTAEAGRCRRYKPAETLP